jgi:hypothetical protein
MLNKEAILEAGKVKTKTVEIPEWGGEVIIRQLDASELLSLTNDVDGSMTAALSVVDESGARVFSDDDLPALRKLAAAGRLRLNRAINEFNGILAVTEAAKN